MKTIRKLDGTILAELKDKKLTGMRSRFAKDGLITTLVFDNGAMISFNGYTYVNNEKKERSKK